MVVNDIMEYFKSLAPYRLNQRNGRYRTDISCCVGAHLAHFMNAGSCYTEGMDAWGRHIGGNAAHGLLLLRNAGAGWDPFGGAEWPMHPAKVFENLMAVEDLPDTRGANFTDVELSYCDLSKGDFRYSTFFGTTLVGTKFREADLTGAIINGAEAPDADFSNARFDHAHIIHSYMYDCRFKGASFIRTNMRHTDFSKSDFERAYFEDAVASGVRLKKSIFHKTRVNSANADNAPADKVPDWNAMSKPSESLSDERRMAETA